MVPFHLYAGDESRSVVLVRGLGDVHAVALHPLLTLLAVLRLRVVRVLDAVGRNGLLVTWRDLTMLHNILLLKHMLQEAVLRLDPHQNRIDDASQLTEPLKDGLGVAFVHSLLGVLLQPGLDLLPQGWIQEAEYSYLKRPFLLFGDPEERPAKRKILSLTSFYFFNFSNSSRMLDRSSGIFPARSSC